MSVRFTNPYLALGLLTAVLAFALGACSEDDEPTQTTAPAVTGASDATDADKAPGTEAPEDEPAPDPASDETAIKSTLEMVLTGDESAQVCDALVTERFLRRSYGDATGCQRAQSRQRTADKVKLSRLVVTPDSLAQAQAEPKGGLFDGETLRAELVLDEGVWKLDSLRSNVPVGP